MTGRQAGEDSLWAPRMAPPVREPFVNKLRYTRHLNTMSIMHRISFLPPCLGIALLGLATVMMLGCEADSVSASGGADTSQSDGGGVDATGGELIFAAS